PRPCPVRDCRQRTAGVLATADLDRCGALATRTECLPHAPGGGCVVRRAPGGGPPGAVGLKLRRRSAVPRGQSHRHRPGCRIGDHAGLRVRLQPDHRHRGRCHRRSRRLAGADAAAQVAPLTRRMRALPGPRHLSCGMSRSWPPHPRGAAVLSRTTSSAGSSIAPLAVIRAPGARGPAGGPPSPGTGPAGGPVRCGGAVVGPGGKGPQPTLYVPAPVTGTGADRLVALELLATTDAVARFVPGPRSATTTAD